MECFEGSAACTDCFVGLGSDRLCLKLGRALGHERGLCVPENPQTVLYYITATHTRLQPQQHTDPHKFDVKG